MALPALPSPCPDLRPGRSLGAPEHQGFAATWNWILGIFRNASKYIVSSVNGASGDISISAGDGVDIHTSGSTVTISLGSGNNTNDNPGGGGGGGGGGSGGGGGNPTPGNPTPGNPTPGNPTPGNPTPGNPTPGNPTPGGTDCNGWSDEDEYNSNDDGGMDNFGDSCDELNGW